ncbi:hypothetical protein E2C01_038380 [Portunus trituberculatus]|uniref:Uncharacterized protein n=1 Tax=Portunus trituberculatus TaxID=210409 RepID=A0A5B7FE12_PORTR|nr:hypothetical protein [Portunus trituberculatus]
METGQHELFSCKTQLGEQQLSTSAVLCDNLPMLTASAASTMTDNFTLSKFKNLPSMCSPSRSSTSVMFAFFLHAFFLFLLNLFRLGSVTWSTTFTMLPPC